MKCQLFSLTVILVLVVAIKAKNHVGAGIDEKEHGLSCEATEGCCVDSLDCPGCCNPPYDNQCSNLKGISLNFCEITGTYFITRINIDPDIFLPATCPSINIAGNYPGQCQGALFVNSKLQTTDCKNNKTVLIPLNSTKIDIIRFSSCGHAVAQLSDFNNLQGQFSQYAEPFLLNVVIVARNDAGLAILACYAIDESPAFLVFILSPTPKPNQWALAELEETIEPYYTYNANGQLYLVSYEGCYPSLDILNYAYV